MDMAAIKERLESELLVLNAQIPARMSGSHGTETRANKEPADFGIESLQNEMTDAHTADKQRRRNRIVFALGKINSGIFGSCSRCGGQIDEKRLRIDPVVERCLQCEEVLEAERRLARETGKRPGSYTFTRQPISFNL